jgi:hypothetical protein
LVTLTVNVTGAPLQTALLLVDTVAIGIAVLPVTVILLDVAVVVVAQLALDVSTQLTTSLLLSVDVVKIALLVPALLPFTFHW